MKLIVYKKDIKDFLIHFKSISSYDIAGDKHYFVFEDVERKGNWTLMFYEDENIWTKHGKGPGYCDEGETKLTKEELVSFLYKNRKYINNVLRNLKELVAI